MRKGRATRHRGKDRLDTIAGAGERPAVEYVAASRLEPGNAGKGARGVRASRQHADALAARGQHADDLATERAGGTGDEDRFGHALSPWSDPRLHTRAARP
jgi:hypothetical protein